MNFVDACQITRSGGIEGGNGRDGRSRRYRKDTAASTRTKKIEEDTEDQIETKAIGRLGRVTNSAYRSRTIRQDSLRICSRAPRMIQNSGLPSG